MYTREPTTAVFALDYDGCVAGERLTRSNFRKHTKPLVDDMVAKVIQGRYKNILILSASNRLTALLDWVGNNSNSTASLFEILPLLKEELERRLRGIGLDVTVSFDKTLLTDFHANVELGTNFNLSRQYDLTDATLKEEEIGGNVPCMDESKFLLIYTLMQHVSSKLIRPERADLFYYEDLTYVINDLVEVFDRDKFLVPANITLKPIEYRYKCGVIDTYTHIAGCGKPSKNENECREKSLALLLSCFQQEVRGSHLTCAEDVYKVCSLTYPEIARKYEDQKEFGIIYIDDHLGLYEFAKAKDELHPCLLQTYSQRRSCGLFDQPKDLSPSCSENDDMQKNNKIIWDNLTF
jgi:hypothetical protein